MLLTDLCNRVRVGLWKLEMHEEAKVQRLLGEYLGSDTIVRKVPQRDGKRSHDLFVDRDRWAAKSQANLRALERVEG